MEGVCKQYSIDSSQHQNIFGVNYAQVNQWRAQEQLIPRLVFGYPPNIGWAIDSGYLGGVSRLPQNPFPMQWLICQRDVLRTYFVAADTRN